MIAAAIQLKRRHVEERFRLYVDTVYEGERLDRDQFLEVRRAFYGGAAALFGLFASFAGNQMPVEEDEEGLDMVVDVSDELADFRERLMRGDA